MDETLFNFYSKPTQYGGELPYFVGERYNAIGGGFLGSIGRFLLPILKSVGRAALGVAAGTADDVLNKNKAPEDAIVRNTTKAIKRKIAYKQYEPTQFDKRRRKNGPRKK